MFGELISAIPTPFDQDNNIDTLTLEQFLKSVAAGGSDSIVAAGTTGEGTSLTLEERLYLFELCKKLAPKYLKVIGNVGTNNTIQTQNLICMADFLDLDGYMCAIPYYVKPTQEGIYQHFKSIASVTDKPIIIYNCPSRCGCSIEVETILRIVEECPNIIGIKHASNDLDFIRQLKKMLPDFKVYIGDDKMLIGGLRAGADGIISVTANVFGRDVLEVIENFRNNVEDANLIDYVDLLSQMMFLQTNPIPIKYILSKKYTNFKNLRLPLTPLDKEYQNYIDQILG